MKHIVAFLASLLFFGSATAAVEQPDAAIPFKYNRYLYVRATLCDTLHGTFLFDTGAGITMLDTALLSNSGLLDSHTQPITLMGTGSTPIKSRYISDSIKITLGSYNKYINAAVLVKLTDLLTDFIGVDGVLGIALFKDTTFAIDYTKQTLSLVSTLELDSLTGYDKIPFTFDKSRLMAIDVTTIVSPTKHIKGKVHIDTGNPKSLDFAPDKRQLKKLRQNISQSISYDVASVGIGGGGSRTIFKAQGLQIGTCTIPTECLGIIENGSTIKSKSLGGMLGNNILSKFHVIVDMKGGNLYLKPNDSFATTLPPNYTGVYISRFPHKLFVNGTSRHTTPLQQGDVITAINGAQIDTMTDQQVETVFCTPDLQYTMTVLRDDNTLQLSIINLNATTLWQ